MARQNREGSEVRTHGVARVARRIDPSLVAAALLVLVLLGAVVTAWRYAKATDRPARTYYEFQLERWEQLLASKPNDPAVWATLGSLHAKNGDRRAAAEAYAKALKLDPENAAALVFQARAAEKDGRLKEARSLLARAQRSLPEGGRYLVYFELGELERRAGNTVGAAKAYEASIEDNGTFWNAPYRLAVLREGEGELDAALAAARSAQRFAPRDKRLQTLIDRLEERGAVAPSTEETSMQGVPE